jgi:hypothetical protein
VPYGRDVFFQNAVATSDDKRPDDLRRGVGEPLAILSGCFFVLVRILDHGATARFQDAVYASEVSLDHVDIEVDEDSEGEYEIDAGIADTGKVRPVVAQRYEMRRPLASLQFIEQLLMIINSVELAEP